MSIWLKQGGISMSGRFVKIKNGRLVNLTQAGEKEVLFDESLRVGDWDVSRTTKAAFSASCWRMVCWPSMSSLLVATTTIGECRVASQRECLKSGISLILMASLRGIFSSPMSLRTDMCVLKTYMSQVK